MKVKSPLRPGLEEGFQESHKAAQGVDCHTACVYREHIYAKSESVCVHLHCVFMFCQVSLLPERSWPRPGSGVSS